MYSLMGTHRFVHDEVLSVFKTKLDIVGFDSTAQGADTNSVFSGIIR